MYGAQACSLSQRIFDIFDEDGSGRIDFAEYMMVRCSRSYNHYHYSGYDAAVQAINSSNMHTPESKLMWIFNVFDKVFSAQQETPHLQIC